MKEKSFHILQAQLGENKGLDQKNELNHRLAVAHAQASLRVLPQPLDPIACHPMSLKPPLRNFLLDSRRVVGQMAPHQAHRQGKAMIGLIAEYARRPK